ncbi:hypothetical protein DID78_06025 [Candidatus Marinamargulisbacteria bacterium SCGC AG-343-D04]|nr:hypothetical protein DID78_06025 [Candidatus Marinamargulisbacteria bacterium SCGC AG-343-D04]
MLDQKRVVCITGGSRGIGAACVRRFLKECYHVVYCSRNKEDLFLLKDELSSEYDTALLHPFEADMASLDDISQLFSYIQKQFGVLNCLINNAAVIEVANAESVSIDSFKKQMDVNVLGVFSCIQNAIPLMKESGGNIVNVSSLSGIKGVEKFPGFSVYAMTKSSIVGLTEVLAVELKEFNINVNCIAPGAVDTDMLRYAAPDLKTTTMPENIADSIYFLSNPSQSSQLTGSILEVHSNE